ncbi:O-antigen ligase family protein [Vibrio sp. C8]
MILPSKFKQNLEAVFLLSPFFWAWGIVFNFPDTKHVLSRLLAVISLYSLFFYRHELKDKLNNITFRLFIGFCFSVAIFYSFLHFFNSGHFDFARVVWSVSFYFLFIPRSVFTKKNFLNLIAISSVIICSVAWYQFFSMHISRVGFIVNSGPYAYVIGMTFIVTFGIACDGLGRNKYRQGLIFLVLSVSLLSVIILSQTRTSWLALSVVVLVQLANIVFRKNWRALIIILPTILLFFISIKSFEVVEDRINSAHAEYNKLIAENYNSSFGARVDMWRNGWEIFKLSPYIGVNASAERSAIQASHKNGTMERAAFSILNQERPSYHNVFIQSLVKGGLLAFVFAVIWCLLFSLGLRSQQVFIKRTCLSLIVYTLVSTQLESQFTIYSATTYFYLLLVGFFMMLVINENPKDSGFRN